MGALTAKNAKNAKRSSNLFLKTTNSKRTRTNSAAQSHSGGAEGQKKRRVDARMLVMFLPENNV
ncbi:MAG: hypothetical protein WAW23_00550 [Candidatus Methanoperedens sp.]